MKVLKTSQMATVKANGWCSIFGSYEIACKVVVAVIEATA